MIKVNVGVMPPHAPKQPNHCFVAVKMNWLGKQYGVVHWLWVRPTKRQVRKLVKLSKALIKAGLNDHHRH